MNNIIKISDNKSAKKTDGGWLIFDSHTFSDGQIVLANSPCNSIVLSKDEIRVIAELVQEYYFWEYLENHIAWSLETFGPGERAEGLCKHIESELDEVRTSNGKDIYEWIDIIILAIDGAWRAGFSSSAIIQALQEKQTKNKQRKWKRVAPDQPSFHERQKDE